MGPTQNDNQGDASAMPGAAMPGADSAMPPAQGMPPAPAAGPDPMAMGAMGGAADPSPDAVSMSDEAPAPAAPAAPAGPAMTAMPADPAAPAAAMPGTEMPQDPGANMPGAAPQQ